jgi:hypothetical protein
MAPTAVADNVIGAFFFAMRSCKYLKPQIYGKTKCIDLDGLIFRMPSNTVVAHSDPVLLTLAKCVTVTFVNQKEWKKDGLLHPLYCAPEKIFTYV